MMGSLGLNYLDTNIHFYINMQFYIKFIRNLWQTVYVVKFNPILFAVSLFFSRHVIFILIGVLSLVDGLLLVLAVMLGLCGSMRYDTPNTRSNIADLGGRLMIG